MNKKRFEIDREIEKGEIKSELSSGRDAVQESCGRIQTEAILRTAIRTATEGNKKNQRN